MINFFRAAGARPNASALVKDVLTMSQTMNVQEPTEEFNARVRDVVDRWESGDLPFKDALDLMQALEREAREAPHHANQGRVEVLMGVMQGYRANLDASIAHFERARDLFERANNRPRALGCILNLGESYRLKGNFTRARQMFRAAFEGARDVGSIDTQTIAAFNEAQILLSMDHYESARTALDKAYALAQQISTDKTASARVRSYMLAEIPAVQALVAVHFKQLDQAWDYACDALLRARQIDQLLYIGGATRAFGEVLTALGTLPEGADPSFSADPDDYFREALEAYQRIKADGEAARTMYAHALSLKARGRGMSAARKLQQAMIIFTRLGMTDDAAKAARAQMDMLANTGSADTEPGE